MNLQDERIQAACDALSLSAIAEHYPALATEAVDGDASYADFLEHCLKAEQDERRSRSQALWDTWRHSRGSRFDSSPRPTW